MPRWTSERGRYDVAHVAERRTPQLQAWVLHSISARAFGPVTTIGLFTLIAALQRRVSDATDLVLVRSSPLVSRSRGYSQHWDPESLSACRRSRGCSPTGAPP